MVEPKSKRTKHNGVTREEYERLRNIAYSGASNSRDIITPGGQPDYDPWACDGDEVVEQSMFDDFDKPKLVRAPRTLKEAPISLVEGSTSYPAVPKPHAGKSYNPVFEDWNQLLVDEGNNEVEAERNRIEEAHEEQLKLDRIAASENQNGEPQTEEESAWEGLESEYEKPDWLDKRRPQRKTRVERNKVKRRKEVERQHQTEVEMKKRAQQGHKIKEIAREVDREEKARAAVLSSAKHGFLDADENAALRRRKLGASA